MTAGSGDPFADDVNDLVSELLRHVPREGVTVFLAELAVPIPAFPKYA